MREEIDRLINNIVVLQKNLADPLYVILSSEDSRIIFGFQKGTIELADDLLDEIKKVLGEING